MTTEIRQESEYVQGQTHQDATDLEDHDEQMYKIETVLRY